MVQFQNRDLEKEQLAHAMRPIPSNLLETVVNDIANFVVESSPEEVGTKYFFFVFTSSFQAFKCLGHLFIYGAAKYLTVKYRLS